MKQCSLERTGWRDAEISGRHRLWGFNCPAVDLDFVMMEYNHGKPCALVEYKHERAEPFNPRAANYRALVALANGYAPGALPCFVAVYDPADWTFIVHPLNDAARNHYCTSDAVYMSEREFVRELHLIRRAVLSLDDETAIAQLNDKPHSLARVALWKQSLMLGHSAAT